MNLNDLNKFFLDKYKKAAATEARSTLSPLKHMKQTDIPEQVLLWIVAVQTLAKQQKRPS